MLNRIRKNKLPKVPDPIELLVAYPGLMRMDQEGRTKMTISCRDTDNIPKVAGAGDIKTVDGKKIQIMHQGTLVELGGYHGEWMTEIIKELKGHHEPQEEKIFHEVLKQIKPDSWMIELGSFWAFYSLWFNKTIKEAHNICCEPDPHNIEIGKRNNDLNNANLEFLQSAAGKEDELLVDVVMDSDPTKSVNVPVRTVDSLVKEYKIDSLEMLHLDVQGFEYEALQGAIETIKSGKLRFVFISTHHYAISKNANLHAECLEFVKNMKGSIIASHTVAESFSGDGLIVASFSEEDRDFMVETSLNHTDASLFRPSEEDVQILVNSMRNLSA